MARCVGIGTQQSVVELEPTVASVALFYAATAYIKNLTAVKKLLTSSSYVRLIDVILDVYVFSLLAVYLLSALCMDKFPGVTQGQLGAAVNGKLTELRLKTKAAPSNSSSDPAVSESA